MDKRQPADVVVRGATTTADKIRALGRAGYTRAEIARRLGIRYQHARNVLVAAGIGTTVATAEPERPPKDEVPPPSLDGASWEVLLRSGFRFIGEWVSDQEGGIRLDAKAPSEPGVYAMVVDDVVRYVGLTLNSLQGRMGHYRLGHERQRTSARVKRLIVATLADGQRVKVLVATPPASAWNGLPVMTAAGLEAGLIQMLRPAWNKQGIG